MHEFQLVTKSGKNKRLSFDCAALPGDPSPPHLRFRSGAARNVLECGSGRAQTDRRGYPALPPLLRDPLIGAGLAHDARNLLAALNLYCELLASPGVLAPRFRHYSEDLRRVGETGARLVEALAGRSEDSGLSGPAPGIRDLASEVRSMQPMLASLAGPRIRVEVECAPCAGQLALGQQDLLRILFNLVANAVEAIRRDQNVTALRRQGFVRITAQRGEGASFLAPSAGLPGTAATVVLSVRDNGPGMGGEMLDRIFEAGFSTRPKADSGSLQENASTAVPAGLGLAIVRQLAEAAGGGVRVVSAPGSGTRFDLEFPILAADGAPLKLPARLRRVQRGVGAVTETGESRNIPPQPGKGAYNARNNRT